jgi:hypothetical protein
LLEVILEMSGPQMLGISGDCRLRLDPFELLSCKGSPGVTVGQYFVDADRPERAWWLTLGGGYYFSTNKTIRGRPFGYFDVNMLTFDPMIETASQAWDVGYSELDLHLYHGAGVSLNALFAEGVPASYNTAIKLRPFGIVVPFSNTWGIDFSYDLRLYPNAFEAEDFGPVTTPVPPQGREAVHAFVFGVRKSF